MIDEDAIDDFSPTEDVVLCTVVPEAEMSGRIIIPDSARVLLTQGVVLKAGTSCNKELYCKGRLIVFRMHTESKVTIGGVDYLLVEPVNTLLIGPVLKEK